MNDAEFAREMQRIATLTERWVKPLGLNWWHITMSYVREDFTLEGKPAPECVAAVEANWTYADAHIAFNMPAVATRDDDDLERHFVHELMHIFLAETREAGEDWLKHEERVATTLCKAFLWLRDELAMDVERPLNGATVGTATFSLGTG